MSSSSLEEVNLSEFQYDLPDEKIAKYPLKNRSESKLLCYKQGKIQHKKFNDILSVLPPSSHLIFNDTKVIPARLVFHKITGARIEIFLLDPARPSNLYEETMASKGKCTWNVMIGNAKKWPERLPLKLKIGVQEITANRTSNDQVEFSWSSNKTFSEMLEAAGNIPLPPYLGRNATEEDRPRYQTVYSKAEGAVAAPTAGLHFTTAILKELNTKGISSDYVTLHVSAGTFQPIKSSTIQEHPMHKEQIVIHRRTIEVLLEKEPVIAVGTTSMRTLESLYWFGNKLAENAEAEFFIEKLAPYKGSAINKREALQNVLKFMDDSGSDMLIGHTEIFIYPGYSFKICQGLITNFHLPGSTLILLVAAFIGRDWKKVYREALENNYRFLSYGDSSLLLPKSY